MKMTPVLTIASTFLAATLCTAGERHETDEGLEQTLRAAVNEKHVHIHVHHGIVTMDGQVPSDVERQRVEDIVRGTSGVVGVKDELRVASPSPSAGVTVTPVVPLQRRSIPVYTTPPPEVAPPAVVVTPPAPVIVPEYPKLKVQAATPDDVDMANRIAHQMQTDAVPAAGFDNVTIKVRNGIVSMRGFVTSREDHDAIIASIQQAGGVSAIYDELKVR